MTDPERMREAVEAERYAICTNCWVVLGCNGEQVDHPTTICSHLRGCEVRPFLGGLPPEGYVSAETHERQRAGYEAALKRVARERDEARGAFGSPPGRGVELSEAQMNALIHAAGYVLRGTYRHPYPHLRGELLRAQEHLQAELSAREETP